jgi:predicted Zn-dependent protease with MMP-like domain
MMWTQMWMQVWMQMWMDERSFEELVAEALDGLPADIARLLENVEVLVDDWPSRRQAEQADLGPGELLLGLYEGVPLTERTRSYSLVLPDRITIFRGSILRLHRSPVAVREQVRQTVIHELAHHFGIDDDRLVELGAY